MTAALCLSKSPMSSLMMAHKVILVGHVSQFVMPWYTSLFFVLSLWPSLRNMQVSSKYECYIHLNNNEFKIHKPFSTIYLYGSVFSELLTIKFLTQNWPDFESDQCIFLFLFSSACINELICKKKKTGSVIIARACRFY